MNRTTHRPTIIPWQTCRPVRFNAFCADLGKLSLSVWHSSGVGRQSHGRSPPLIHTSGVSTWSSYTRLLSSYEPFESGLGGGAGISLSSVAIQISWKSADPHGPLQHPQAETPIELLRLRSINTSVFRGIYRDVRCEIALDERFALLATVEPRVT